MSVIAHPSKSSVARFGVKDKESGVFRYFSVSKYGSVQAARSAAEELDKKINKDVGIKVTSNTKLNDIFDADGSVIGLKRTVLERLGSHYDAFTAKLYHNKRQYVLNVEINKNKPFEESYKEIQNQILKRLKIKRTPEITKKFNACESLYLVNEDAEKLKEKRKLERVLFSAKW